MATIKHENRAAKVLYDFTLLSSADSDVNRVVFLSERDYAIILTATEKADVLRHRVFYDADGEYYNTVNPDDFTLFSSWVNDLRNRLGEWPVSNEYLRRIAEALESLDEKAETFVTWEEFLEDIETTLGTGSILYQLLRGFIDLFPNLSLKLDAKPLVLAFWDYYSWKAPLLALLGGMNASLAVSAAAAVASKGIEIYRSVLDTLGTINQVANNWRDFVLGDWSVYQDFLKPLLDKFFSDEDGGTGGDDPDADPALRPIVRVANNVQNVVNATVECNTCSGGGGCGCGGLGSAPVLDDPEAPGPEIPGGDPPDWDSGVHGEYGEYKCKAANTLALSIFELLATMQYWQSKTWPIGVVPNVIVNYILDTITVAGFVNPGFTAQSALVAATRAICAYHEGFCEGGFSYTVSWGSTETPATLRLRGITNRSELVCGLFESETVSEARAVITSFIEAQADGLPASEVEWCLDTLSDLMTYNWANRLFKWDGITGGYTDESAVDCAMCGFDMVIRSDRGSLTSMGGEWVGTSEGFGGGWNRLAFERGDGGCFVIDEISIPGWTPPGAYVGDSSGLAVYEEGVGEINPVPYGDVTGANDISSYLEGKSFRWVDIATLDHLTTGDEAFTATFTVSEC